MDSKPMREAAEDAAAAWLLRRESAAWTDADQTTLERWLDASAHHRVAFLRLQAVWSGADRLKSVSAGLSKGEIPPRGAIEQSPFFALRRGESIAAASAPAAVEPGRSRRKWLYPAAAVLVLAAGLFLSSPEGSFLQRGTVYKTAIGGLSTVPTADGSIVTLNTDSEIEVKLTDQERRIDLRRGEAFFDIAKDPSRPFVVHVNHRRVVAVGTKFSVRLDDGAVRVVVTEGRVRVDAANASPSGDALDAGAVAEIDETRLNVQQHPVAQLEQSLSWRNGYIVLDDTLLPQAVAEFNRYNTRQLVIDDPALLTIRVGGNFRANNIDGFLRLLEQGFKVEANAVADHRIGLSQKK